MRKWIRHLVVPAGFLAMANLSPAQGAECSDLTKLIELAQNNFAESSDDAANPNDVARGGTCGVSLQLGGVRLYRCHWKFGYRDAAAGQAFAAKDQMLQKCTGATAQAPQDQQVNHPDSYDLRAYEAGEVRLTTSIKDKGALQETYVFLAIYGVKSN